jgi:hypothetical protein
MNILATFLSRLLTLKVLLPVCLCVMLLFAASVPHHSFNDDEGYIGEHAFFLARDGYVHSNFFKGISHQEQYLVVYHRLFVAAGSWSIKAFGFSIHALRAVSLVSVVVLMLLLAAYMRHCADGSTTEVALALVLLMSVSWHGKFVFAHTVG